MLRKLPFAVVLLKISAQKRGLGVLSESQHGIRNATGLLFGTDASRSTHLSYVSFAFARLPLLKNGHGWSSVCVSRLNPSLSQVCSCGSFGSRELVMMLTGARPSIFLRRRRIGRRNVS